MADGICEGRGRERHDADDSYFFHEIPQNNCLFAESIELSGQS
jgi:hypothetical protein